MPQTTEVEQFLLAIGPFYEEEEEEVDNETKAKPVTAETTTEEAPNEEMTSTEVPTEPTNENVPPKPTNQMSDDSEDGEGSGSETDESVDFKDSFQELSVSSNSNILSNWVLYWLLCCVCDVYIMGKDQVCSNCALMFW